MNKMWFLILIVLGFIALMLSDTFGVRWLGIGSGVILFWCIVIVSLSWLRDILQ